MFIYNVLMKKINNESDLCLNKVIEFQGYGRFCVLGLGYLGEKRVFKVFNYVKFEQ